jgi:hypothetical protein
VTVDIPSRFLNLRRHRQGWRNAMANEGLHFMFDLSPLPAGYVALAGVPFAIEDGYGRSAGSFVGLKGFGSPSTLQQAHTYAIGERADYLFFLHAVNAAPGFGDSEGPVELFRYIVRYEDGTTEAIPVRWQQEVGDWYRRRDEQMNYPDPPSNARVAWHVDFDEQHNWRRAHRVQLAMYQMTWANPHPERVIHQIDIENAAEVEKPEESPAAPIIAGITLGVLPED